MKGALAALVVFRLSGGAVSPEEGADRPVPVGSLQKAFVLAAYARAHPEVDALPSNTCDAASRCWLAKGHGSLGLRAATTRSCNAYFRRLAAEAPESERLAALTGAGFRVRGRVSPDVALGLASADGAVTISPRDLLRAYAAFVTEPWAIHDDWRREFLLGMRDAAVDGTASGFALSGLLVKTGTVPALDGRPLGTSGFALAIDPTGVSGWLAFEAEGNGASAAQALSHVIARDEPALVRREVKENKVAMSLARTAPLRAVPAEVHVRLLSALRGATIHATNVDDQALRAEGGGLPDWVGPGVEVRLGPGATLASGRWRLRVEPYGLVRVVEGSLAHRTAAGRTSLVLTTPLRSYVEGVLRGELGRASLAKYEELAAAALRFLARGARHGGEDVCDLSHCARFVGFGPEVAWPRPDRAVMREAPDAPISHLLGDASWQRALEASRHDGPWTWSAHCGGMPLSEREVWGAGSGEAALCPAHHEESATWTRSLPARDLATVFGAPVISMEALVVGGVRKTRVTTSQATLLLPYDELHRRLATRLPWDALPSPPDRYERAADAFVVSGRGSGHRVGVCLAGPPGAASPTLLSQSLGNGRASQDR